MARAKKLVVVKKSARGGQVEKFISVVNKLAKDYFGVDINDNSMRQRWTPIAQASGFPSLSLMLEKNILAKNPQLTDAIRKIDKKKMAAKVSRPKPKVIPQITKKLSEFEIASLPTPTPAPLPTAEKPRVRLVNGVWVDKDGNALS